MKKSPTNETTNLILHFFLRNGIFARRHSVSSGSAEYTNKKGESRTRYIHAGITGGSDIFAWLPFPAPWLGIEVKTGKDRLRPEQEGFIRQIEMMGHLTIVVKTYDDFLLQVIPIFKKFRIPLLWKTPQSSPQTIPS